MSRFWRFIFLIVLSPAAFLTAAAQKKSAVQRTQPTSVPYDDATGLLIIPVSVEGKTYHFLFDTGSFTALSPDLGRRLKLKKEGRVNFVDANNMEGSASFQELKEISVGTFRFYNKKVAVFPSPLFKCLNIDGVLGNDLLVDYAIYIDPEKKQLTLSNNIADFKLAQHNTFVSPVVFTRQMSPFIDTKLTHEATGIFVTIFDTGFRGLYQVARASAADSTLTDYFAVLDSGKIKGSNALSVYDKNIETIETQYRLLLPELHIGNATFLNVHVQSMDKSYNALGIELLKYGGCILDNKNKRFYFFPDTPVVNLDEREWPLSFGLSDDDLIITYVWDPRLRDEFEVGDQVLAIGQHAYNGNNFCDLLSRPPFPETATAEEITVKDKKGVIKKLLLKKEDYD
ncbi:retropepsin-like aspartic protease [Niabella soli]|uniref:Aspartyl protease n=1 Tax=Niabella soli DSM 19437 TaxID=929713 RepID=W0F6D0_9BACT|nr:retropepsin-like aspartic protease [Niabella soli]AHF17014.1 hypothetical protein NIASO_00255 [Niabella soli DSM 19437]